MYSKPQRKRNTLQSSRPFHGAFFDDDPCKVPCKSKSQHFHFGCLNVIILEGSRAWIRRLHTGMNWDRVCLRVWKVKMQVSERYLPVTGTS